MKKKIFSIIMLLVLVVPCAIMFSACGKDKDKEPETPPPPAEAKVSEVELALAEEHGYNYDAETNTISFVYGASIELLKENFVVTASLDDNTTKNVSDYTIDTSAISGTPNVGTYVVNFTYKEKSVSVNVKVTPKPIEKPTFRENQFFTFIEDQFTGVKQKYSPEINGFDENSMQYVSGSTIEAENVGEYYIEIVPDSNHVWMTDEDGESSNSDAVRFDWRINKNVVKMSSPETLLFEYDGTEKKINFVDYSPQYYPFEKYFEIVIDENSTDHATEKGDYTVTVKLNETKAQSYMIVELNYSKDDDSRDYVLSEDGSVITYYWHIV